DRRFEPLGVELEDHVLALERHDRLDIVRRPGGAVALCHGLGAQLLGLLHRCHSSGLSYSNCLIAARSIAVGTAVIARPCTAVSAGNCRRAAIPAPMTVSALSHSSHSRCHNWR